MLADCAFAGRPASARALTIANHGINVRVRVIPIRAEILMTAIIFLESTTKRDDLFT